MKLQITLFISKTRHSIRNSNNIFPWSTLPGRLKVPGRNCKPECIYGNWQSSEMLTALCLKTNSPSLLCCC
ncbi:unnamed protein product [Orchesella dallaii]|uniref:Uncharacterized protein n=1 Tax=Orchesella dallaii TaxID=48710 RepID=A0ABP1Q2X7_9HEXA